MAREITEDKVILPIWHGVTREQVVQFSPPLADKLAIDTQIGSQAVAIQCLKVIRPDIYAKHSHDELARIGSGRAVQELGQEIDGERRFRFLNRSRCRLFWAVCLHVGEQYCA